MSIEQNNNGHTKPGPITGKPPVSKWIKVFVIFSFSCLGYVVFFLKDDRAKAKEQTTEVFTPEQVDSTAKADLLKEHGGMAYIMSQDFVKEKLVSPGSADFPFDIDRNFVEARKDSVFTVLAYVDSQNGYGALLRSYFKAKLKYHGNDKWSLLDLNMDEK